MSPRRPLLHLLLFLALLCGLAAPAAPQTAQPVAHRHMVAAAHPLAVDAGLAMLRRGGSAVDAAIAVQMVLGVVEPQASGLGGGGFLLHYDAADRRLLAYDGRETAPAGATPGLFLKPDGTPLPFPQAVVGGASVGVPGLPRLLETAHRVHGRLPWQDLFAPAIALAEGGFAMPPRLARALAQEKALQASAEARQVYFRADGTPAALGERITNPALAQTMRTLAAEGAEALYRGPIAEDIVRAVQTAARPGTLSPADLAAWRPVVREPVCGGYRAWTLCGMPPPSSGPLAVLQALAMLEPFDLAREAPNSLRAAHLIGEASRLAFADRARFVADPEFVPVPVRELLDRTYLAGRAALISEQRALTEVTPGTPVPGRRGHALDASVEIPATSHISVVDEAGNVVTFTTTIEGPFGSRLFVRGFPLNNELTDFSFVAERDGRLVANRVQPRKRPRSSMSPMIVLDRERGFVMALGSAGGARIIGDVLHTAIAVLDWDLPMQQAIALPRVLDRNEGLELEAGTAVAAHAEALRALGHRVEVQPHNGGLSGIRRRGALLEGGADPRRDGVAKGD